LDLTFCSGVNEKSLSIICETCVHLKNFFLEECKLKSPEIGKELIKLTQLEVLDVICNDLPDEFLLHISEVLGTKCLNF
jgi:hypothetical protein